MHCVSRSIRVRSRTCRQIFRRGKSRMAGAQDGDVKENNGLLLYHHYYSFYSQKVVMALHEKHLSYESEIINITQGEQYSARFLDINPHGEVPVLQDNGKIIPDSSRILDYLEDNFSNGSVHLIPTGQNASARAKVYEFRTALDALPAGVLTMGSFFHPELCRRPKLPFIAPVRKMLRMAENNSSANLREHAEKHEKARSILLQKATFQDKKHELVSNKEEYLKILASVDAVLGKVEDELATHDADSEMWLCDEKFTAADISLTILLERLNSLGLEHHFWSEGKRPLLEKYYARVQQRPSYKAAVPNLLFHIKAMMASQPPEILAAGAVAFIGLVIGSTFVMKKILF